MGKFFYGQSTRDSKWYFRLKDGNNETILSSTEGYNTKQGCLNGIDSVKKHSPYEQYYTSFIGSDYKYYFRLSASNGEPIGKSEGYNSTSGRDQGKENCKKEAPNASIHELSGGY
jgi:uncharacterized protein YegP (UPF0339 family)